MVISKFQQQLVDKTKIWPGIDKYERLYFVSLNTYIDVSASQMADYVKPNYKKIPSYQGILIHNHPNGICIPSPADLNWLYNVRSYLPQITHYCIIHPYTFDIVEFSTGQLYPSTIPADRTQIKGSNTSDVSLCYAWYKYTINTFIKTL